jgi:hypothetical protein
VPIWFTPALRATGRAKFPRLSRGTLALFSVTVSSGSVDPETKKVLRLVFTKKGSVEKSTTCEVTVT